MGKLDAFVQIGARFVCLALDDVSSRARRTLPTATRYASLAHAHVELATFGFMRSSCRSDATLWLVPTDYAGKEASRLPGDPGCRTPRR